MDFWTYQPIKEKFVTLANNARINLDAFKANKQSTSVNSDVYDADLATFDVYEFLSTSYFSTENDFINTLKLMSGINKKMPTASDEKKFHEARRKLLVSLIVQYENY